jgi:hypothetical protein
MNSNTIKKHASLYRILTFLLILLFIVPGFTGCAARKKAKKLAHDLKIMDSRLTKTILVTPFENRTFYQESRFKENFQQPFLKATRDNSSGSRLIVSGDSAFPNDLLQLPRLPDGKINNFALTTIARQHGIHIIVIGELKNIHVDKVEKGMWWFKGTHRLAQIQFKLAAYDTQTAAKLLDNMISVEIEIDESEEMLIASKQSENIPSVDNAIREISVDLGEALGDAAENRAWSGYVTAVSGNTVTISSGKNAGLISGDRFEAFGQREIITGHNGQQYVGFVPKTGEIKINTVFPDKAEATIVSGTVQQTGSSIKPKP